MRESERSLDSSVILDSPKERCERVENQESSQPQQPEESGSSEERIYSRLPVLQKVVEGLVRRQEASDNAEKEYEARNERMSVSESAGKTGNYRGVR